VVHETTRVTVTGIMQGLHARQKLLLSTLRAEDHSDSRPGLCRDYMQCEGCCCQPWELRTTQTADLALQGLHARQGLLLSTLKAEDHSDSRPGLYKDLHARQGLLLSGCGTELRTQAWRTHRNLYILPPCS